MHRMVHMPGDIAFSKSKTHSRLIVLPTFLALNDITAEALSNSLGNYLLYTFLCPKSLYVISSSCSLSREWFDYIVLENAS